MEGVLGGGWWGNNNMWSYVTMLTKFSHDLVCIVNLRKQHLINWWKWRI